LTMFVKTGLALRPYNNDGPVLEAAKT